MPEPVLSTEWAGRVSQIAAVNAEWAGWIVEALGTADQARVAASAAQREKARTSEALLESLAQRLLAASGALDTEREKRQEAERRSEKLHASLKGAVEAARISAEAASAGRGALLEAQSRTADAERARAAAEEQAREAAAAAAAAAQRAQGLAAHVAAVERRHAELLGADAELHAELPRPRPREGSKGASASRRAAPASPQTTPGSAEPEPEPEPQASGGSSTRRRRQSQRRRPASSPQRRTSSPKRTSTPKRSTPTPGFASPTASSSRASSPDRRAALGARQARLVDGVPRFKFSRAEMVQEDTPGVGQYDVSAYDTIAARAGLAKLAAERRSPSRGDDRNSWRCPGDGSPGPPLLGHGDLASRVRPTQRCTFNG